MSPKHAHPLVRSCIFLAATLIAPSCGEQQPPKNPTERLAELRAQYAEIGKEIKALEAQVSKGESGGGNVHLVVTETIETGPFTTYIEVQGRVDARQNVEVTAEAMGVVRSVKVKTGDIVRKGTVLAELDPSVLRKSLEELETQITFAEQMYRKQERLWNQKIGTEMQFLQQKTQYEALLARRSTLETQIDMSRIKAPVDGTVDDVFLKIGQAVSPGLPAFQVVNYNEMRVVAELSETYIAKVRTGDAVRLMFMDYNREEDSRLSYVARNINAINRTFKVESDLPSGGRYNPNMVVVMKIRDYNNPKAIRIPVNLIQQSEQGVYTLVAVTQGKQWVAEKRILKLGSSYEGFSEVLGGLHLGDRLITVGYLDVAPGQAIRTSNPN
ncbi:MAG: efflux RND transporter periplasmic adaptor subunit [Sphingomonadales bacterium]|nr:efflux RND transporter periplasmic adaptor subunit [Sphingomonadales bacterium]